MSFTAKEITDLKKLVAPKPKEVVTVIDDTLTVITDHVLTQDEIDSYKEGHEIWY